MLVYLQALSDEQERSSFEALYLRYRSLMLSVARKKTQTALENAYLGFDNAIDPDLIDCYIYEINSALKRYRFLIHQAQSMQLCKCQIEYEDSLLTEHKLVSQLCPIPNSLSLNHN